MRFEIKELWGRGRGNAAFPFTMCDNEVSPIFRKYVIAERKNADDEGYVSSA